MLRLIRFILYTLLGLFVVIQLPAVQQQIIKYAMPDGMHVSKIRTYGIFPIYTSIPTLIIKKNDKDFIELYNGVLNARYFLFRRQVALNAQQIILYKVPSEKSDKNPSLRESIEQLKGLTILHDFNIGSFQYKDGDRVVFDYKIDWDLKRDLIKLYAKQNGSSHYPDRIEIEGVPHSDDMREGRINVVKGPLCLSGSFTIKNWIVKADLCVNEGAKEIATIHPTINFSATEHIDIPELKIISPIFQWTGLGEVSLNPVSAVLKDERFFLDSNQTTQDGISI